VDQEAARTPANAYEDTAPQQPHKKEKKDKKKQNKQQQEMQPYEPEPAVYADTVDDEAYEYIDPDTSHRGQPPTKRRFWK